MKRGKPVGWLAFCFILSPRSSEVLGQFLAFGPSSALTRVVECSLLARCYLPTLDEHGQFLFYLPLLPSPCIPLPWREKCDHPFFVYCSTYIHGQCVAPLCRGVGIGKFAVFWPTAKFLNYLFTNSLSSIQKLRCLPLVIASPVI